ncbi:hypothetical protein BVRB_4g087570 [Beta vulgaris subsp. vulgaris]|nr:hypothetical protein BVRB_4g087570 [Beta vulgaris subsp. vulgaris]
MGKESKAVGEASQFRCLDKGILFSFEQCFTLSSFGEVHRSNSLYRLLNFGGLSLDSHINKAVPEKTKVPNKCFLKLLDF